jgi:hypothetical protein
MIQVHNPHFLTAQTSLFTVDVLGGVDLMQIERMICTLRITFKIILLFAQHLIYTTIRKQKS